jgi:hypothetical protein
MRVQEKKNIPTSCRGFVDASMVEALMDGLMLTPRIGCFNGRALLWNAAISKESFRNFMGISLISQGKYRKQETFLHYKGDLIVMGIPN